MLLGPAGTTNPEGLVDQQEGEQAPARTMPTAAERCSTPQGGRPSGGGPATPWLGGCD